MAPPLRRVSIQGYRAARELELTPGSVCALVGEASSGKSTVLTAIWTLLEAPRRRRPSTTWPVTAPVAGSVWRPTWRRGRSSSTRGRPTRSTSTARARLRCSSCRRTSARGRSSRLRPDGCRRGRGAAPAADRRPPLGSRRRWARARGGHGAAAPSNLRHFVLLIEEPELYLSPHAQRHLYRLLRALSQSREPDPLLDARAGLSQRRQARGARARPPHADRRHVALPARAARGGRGVPRAVGVRQRPRRALPGALRRARRGTHREADAPARLRRARHRSRQGGDPRARVRRQREHAAVRAGLPTPAASRTSSSTTATRRGACRPSSPSASSTVRSARSPAGGARSC